MFSVSQYSFINLGKFKKDDCGPPEKTSWQRALIILGVRQEEEGINITEAVRTRLMKIPIKLEDYSLGGNEKFQVRDIKSD
jgi:eukaryotic-like serine/threonine-protein kinase